MEELAGVEQLQLVLRPALVVLDEHEKLAEYLGEVATVDLVDDEEVLVLVIVCSLLAEVIEGAPRQFEALLARAVPLDEVLIAVALVELHHLHALGILHAHHRVSQTLCDEGLAHTRSTLQYHILLRAKHSDKGVVGVLAHVCLREEVCLAVSRIGVNRLYDDDLFLFVLEERVDLCHEVGVVGHIGQRLHGEHVVHGPVALVRPFHVA